MFDTSFSSSLIHYFVPQKMSQNLFKSHTISSILKLLFGFLSQVGFQGATTYYMDPLSTTNDIMTLVSGSNIGIPGRYMFRVDGTTVMMPDCSILSGSKLETNYLVCLTQCASSCLRPKRRQTTAHHRYGCGLIYLVLCWKAIGNRCTRRGQSSKPYPTAAAGLPSRSSFRVGKLAALSMGFESNIVLI